MIINLIAIYVVWILLYVDQYCCIMHLYMYNLILIILIIVSLSLYAYLYMCELFCMKAKINTYIHI